MDPTAAAFEAAIVSLASGTDPHADLLRQVEATRAAMETKLLQLYFACEREVLALRAAGLAPLATLVEQIVTAQAAYDQAIDALAQGFPLPPPDEATCSRCGHKFVRGYKGTALSLCEGCVRSFDDKPPIPQTRRCANCGQPFDAPDYDSAAEWCEPCLDTLEGGLFGKKEVA